MNKFINIINKYKLYIIIAMAIMISIFLLRKMHETFFGNSITARFIELGPIYQKMPVYYKGYKIGKTTKIKPSDDYKFTLVKIILFPKRLGLPENITAKVKKFDTGKDYIEIEYPQKPSGYLIKGSIIEGKTSVDIQSFMSAQVESGMFDKISDNTAKTLSSVEKTSDEVRAFFSDTREILKDNRENIKETTENTAQTMENLSLITEYLAELTSKLNNSVSEKKLKNSLLNIEKSTDNIQAATENLKSVTVNVDLATKDLDKTVAKIDSTISEANDITTNVKNMTIGFCETLSKRFAGMRIIFGKPLKNNTCGCKCAKK